MVKGLDDFKAAHDPTFRHEYVGETYHRKINWKKTRRVIVVSAQNATPAHPEWWAILNFMASDLNAELLVIPLRYKNATSVWTASQKNAEWYAPELRPYLWNVSEDMNENAMVLGDLKTQPTSSAPLTGAETLSRASSAIVGHTRAASQSVPTPQSSMAKWMMTSGAVTLPNYSDTRVGRLGQFHHSLSAVLVELAGPKRFYMRRLNYSESTKRVIDLGVAYYAGRKEVAPPSLALVMGDTHVRFVDPAVMSATFGVGGIVERTRPMNLVWHDLLDAHTVNPHHAKNPFADLAKWLSGRASVNDETDEALEFLNARTQQAIALTNNEHLQSTVVPSNHDDMLGRWIMSEDWKKITAENRIFYLETALMMAKGTKMTDTGISIPDPFVTLVNAAGIPNARALTGGEEFVLADVALHLHGDDGPSGARGSRKNLRRIAVKTIIGHSHSPGEDEGCVQTGTSTRLVAEYTGPVGSWLNTHCDLNADGKRQLITMIDGEFCL